MRHPTIHLLRIAGLALLLSVWPIPRAEAGPSPGTTELVIFGGTEYDGAQFSIFGVVLLPKPGLEESSFAVGLAVDHLLTSHLALELDAGFNPRLGEPFEAAVTTTTVGLVYHVNPQHNGVFYLAAGGGAAWFYAADAGIDQDVTGAGMAAIGVKIYLGSQVLLRADFRYFYAPSPFTDQNILRRSTIGIGIRF